MGRPQHVSGSRDRRADGGGAGTPAEGRERGRQGPGPAGLMARGLEVTDGEVGSSLQLLGIRSDPQVELKSILSWRRWKYNRCRESLLECPSSDGKETSRETGAAVNPSLGRRPPPGRDGSKLPSPPPSGRRLAPRGLGRLLTFSSKT